MAYAVVVFFTENSYILNTLIENRKNILKTANGISRKRKKLKCFTRVSFVPHVQKLG